MEKLPIPLPGTDEAIDLGCICPKAAERLGGEMKALGGHFLINSECPIHGFESGAEENKKSE